MTPRFLLSVIIPTRDREVYAIKSIKQVLDIDCKMLQVVVQDNSLSSMLGELLCEYNTDSRLKYNRTVGDISFVENFSIALGLADGEYVCLIGDDDGILPQIIDVVEWAKNNGIDALKPKLSVVFFWPNSSALKLKSDDGYLHIDKMEMTAELFKPWHEVRKLMKRGATDYLSLEMAKLYHGIIRKKCLDDVKSITGTYFGGLSPDIYSSVALSLIVGKVIKLNFPLTISGICSKSGSADSANGKHKGRWEDAPHFRGHKKYEWAVCVPKIYSVETIWADSAHAALKDMNRFDMIDNFNYYALVVDCIFKYPEFKKELKDHIQSMASKKKCAMFRLTLARCTYFFNYLLSRIIRRIKFMLMHESLIEVHGVADIIEANKIFQYNFSKKYLELARHLVVKNSRKKG